MAYPKKKNKKKKKNSDIPETRTAIAKLIEEEEASMTTISPALQPVSS